MAINYFSNYNIVNVYNKRSIKSALVTQILYGQKLKIIFKYKEWLKIKLLNDGYKGYITKKKFITKFKPTHKISELKSIIYRHPKNFTKYNSKKFLPFASKIQILKKHKNFIMFDNQKWLNVKDISPINKKEKNFIKILNLFNDCKYKWGGKTFNGIDCSALIQIFYQFNNKFFPRDTKDQIKYSKINLKRKNFKKGDLIFWKSHVAVCINSKKLVHAYGPEKRVIIMPIKKTIYRIEKTATLKVKKISKI